MKKSALSEKSKAAIYIAAISAGATVLASVFGLFSKNSDTPKDKTPTGPSATMTGITQGGTGNVLVQNLGTINQNAAPVRISAGAKDKVIVDVGAGFSGEGDSGKPAFEAGSFYVITHTGDVTRIEREPGTDFGGFPALDFKVVNNTDETIFFTDVLFSEIESLPDNRPELKWRSRLNFFFRPYPLEILNDGWGSVEDVVFTGTAEAKVINFKIGTIYDKGEIPLPSLLKMALGSPSPPQGQAFHVKGDLRYTFADLDGTRKNAQLPMDISVENYDPGVGAATPPTYYYNTRFETDRKNYQVASPISQTLSPKESDRFTMTIWAKQSSVHQFRLSLRYNKDQQIDVGIFHLSYYLPRSKAHEGVQAPHPERH